MFIVDWLKRFGAKELIKQLDFLEPYFAKKIREAQSRLSSISPDEFSKMLVDDIQLQLCKKFNIDPKDLGL